MARDRVYTNLVLVLSLVSLFTTTSISCEEQPLKMMLGGLIYCNGGPYGPDNPHPLEIYKEIMGHRYNGSYSDEEEDDDIPVREDPFLAGPSKLYIPLMACLAHY